MFEVTERSFHEIEWNVLFPGDGPLFSGACKGPPESCEDFFHYGERAVILDVIVS